MEYSKLTELQLDALREVGNIGAGNAATALSQMVRRRIDMTVPQVDILPLESVISKMGSPDDQVSAVVMRLFGDAPGNMVLLLTRESSDRLIGMLTGQEIEEEISEFQLSALQEIGNILTGAYVNSVFKMTGMMLISSVPAVSCDMLYSLMTTVFIESSQFDEYVMSIETKFMEGNRDINGFFLYIPEPGSLEKLIESLGLENDSNTNKSIVL